MRTVAEGYVTVGRAINLECVGIRKDLLVPVRRRIAHHERIARLDLLAAENVILGGGPKEMGNWGHPADNLLDSTWKQIRVRPEFGQFGRIL